MKELIKAKNVTKIYYNNKIAVKNFNCEIYKGDVVGLLGPNGAGKSTIMRMLVGYIPPTQGDIYINSYKISENPNIIKKFIGYLPENTPLYKDMKVIQYLNYMGILKNLKKNILQDEINRIIEICNLEEVKNKRIEILSKGYKQRVGLAQALLGDPLILIIDEPTAGLDPLQVKETRELLKRVSKHKAIIISSHILYEVEQICNKIIILNNGICLFNDKLEKLLHESKNIIKLKTNTKNKDFETFLKEIKSLNFIEKINIYNNTILIFLKYKRNNIEKTKIFQIINELCYKNSIYIEHLELVKGKLEDKYILYLKKEKKE